MTAQKWVIPKPFRRLAWSLLICCMLYTWGVTVFHVGELFNYNLRAYFTEDITHKNREDVIAFYLENFKPSDHVISEAKSFVDKPRIFFYNRAPKCGSRSVLGVFGHMKGLRNIHSTVVAHHYLSKEEQEDVVQRLQTKPPVVYDRHVPMINFTNFGFPNPIYINVVREPLAHFISHFNFRRHGSRATKKKIEQGLLGKDELERFKMDMDTCVRLGSTECGVTDPATGTLWIRKNIPFFLGQDIHLQNTSSAQLSIAKENARKYYAVVGIVEDLSTFFETLGYMFPDVFMKATAVYNETGKNMKEATSTKVREQASQKTLDILKYRLRYEYEFYYFIRSRIYTLYAHLKKHGGKP